MTISIGWAELLVCLGAWVAVAYFRARAEEGAGSVDTIPGNVLTQAPDAECVEGRAVGFKGRARGNESPRP